jgi:hypothetical protein
VYVGIQSDGTAQIAVVAARILGSFFIFAHFNLLFVFNRLALVRACVDDLDLLQVTKQSDRANPESIRRLHPFWSFSGMARR